jgi:NAD(P)-dependent dehydrogenase (short-subunit alcohol dehydrogenase family)
LAKYPKTLIGLATFDLNDKQALKAAVQQAVDLFGGISIVIANGMLLFW